MPKKSDFPPELLEERRQATIAKFTSVPKCECGKEKTLDLSGSGLWSYRCMPCTAAKRYRDQLIFKTWIVGLSGGSCNQCGYNACYGALEFHHIVPENKRFSLTSAVGTNLDKRPVRKKEIEIELEKCVCLCANCHREIHAEMESHPEKIPEIQTRLFKLKNKVKLKNKWFTAVKNFFQHSLRFVV